MTDETISIARVALARSMARILLAPFVVAIIGGAGVAAGVVVGSGLGIALAVAGGATLLLAGIIARIPLTLRLEVEVGGLRLRWLGGGQRYLLAPGAVTRAAVRGPGRGVLRARFGLLGWVVGPATFRGTEQIFAVRLAPTPSVILVPTEQGRIALAPASEGELLAALGAAARVQQRLDEVSGRLRAATPSPPAEAASLPRIAALPVPPVASPPGGRILTGIERAWLEAQLTAAREAALAAAEAERAAFAEGRPVPGSLPGAAVSGSAAVARRWSAPNAARMRIRASWTRPLWATPTRIAILVAFAWALVPLTASVAAWLIAGSPAASGVGGDARLVRLALLLSGPAAAVGVLATRAWWPRMTGLVATTAVSALLLVARAVTG